MQVQNPLVGPFNRDALQWNDQMAHIPHSRLEDFINGENNCLESPTSFYRKKRYTNAEGSLMFPNEDSYSEHIYFHCAYGPEVGARGQKKTGCHPMRKKESKKRGCLCAFEIRRLYQRPDLIRITYKQMLHVDSSGNPCHGKLDPGSENKTSQYAPYLSQKLRDWIVSKLELGASPQEIMANHHDVLAAAKHSDASAMNARDSLLTMTDVKNISASFLKTKWQFHKVDEQSVHMWREKNMDKIFYYQERQTLERGNDNGSAPFVIGIQSLWQKAKMLQYGHDNVLAFNLTYNTSKYQYQLFTVLVVDHFFNAIPVAWVITPTAKDHDISRWMHALRKSICAALPTWRPSAIVYDDPSMKINAVRSVWDESMPILLSLWRVQRSWLKNVVSKVKGWNTRAMLLGSLGAILEMTCCSNFTYEQRTQKATQLVQDLFAECPTTCSTFIDYFQREWMGTNISLWVKSSQDVLHANQEMHSAFENYHVNLKRRSLNSKNRLMGQRMDWLIYTLESDVEQQYMQMEDLKDGLIRNPRHGKIVLGAFHRARFIPEDHVELPSNIQEPARVRSTSDPHVEHRVYNAGRQGTCCTCTWSRRGSFCKHSVKVCEVYDAGPGIAHFDKYCRSSSISCQQDDSQSNPAPMSQYDNHNVHLQAMGRALMRRTISEQYVGTGTSHSEKVQQEIQKVEAELKDILSGDSVLFAHYLPLLTDLKAELQRVQSGNLCRPIQHPAASLIPSSGLRTKLLHQRSYVSPIQPMKTPRRGGAAKTDSLQGGRLCGPDV